MRTLLAATLALIALPSFAAIYYVAPGGADGGPGTLGNPWGTLQHAADTVVAGDTVVVRGGDHDGFEVTTSGTPALRITFVNYPGETPSITSDISAVRPHGINLEGASYVTVQGFHVAGRTRAGIRAVLCDGVHLIGNVLETNGYWGILTGCCDDLLIAGNRASGSVVEHGIYVSNSGDRPVVRNNVLFDNAANGLHMNGDLESACDGGTAFDGIISDALVEGNTIFRNGDGQGDAAHDGGSGINCDGVQSSLIRNNLIFDAYHSGISLYQIDGGGPSSGNRVENNTVIAADAPGVPAGVGTGRWALNIQDDATGTTVRNNIFFSRHSFRGAMTVCAGCLSGFASDYNLVEDRFTLDDGDTTSTLLDWQGETGQDLHSAAIEDADALDELFVGAAGGNHHLAGPTGVNFGTVVPDLLRDLENRPRPQGGGYDAGAFEGTGGLFADSFEGGSTLRWFDG